MTVKVSDEQSDFAPDTQSLRKLAEFALATEGASEEAELSVAVVDSLAMTRMNETYAGRDGPTDVLAFPMDDATEPDWDDSPPMLLGDVVLCPAVAARQAPEHDFDLGAEMRLLLVHGILHLLGYDHDDERSMSVMRERERAILAASESQERA